jgi:hypothetical protein
MELEGNFDKMEDHVLETDEDITIATTINNSTSITTSSSSNQGEFSPLSSNAEEILQENALDTSLPLVDQLDGDQTSGTCKCTFEEVDPNCVQTAIYLWGSFFLGICGNCFCNEIDKVKHECLLEKIDLENEAKDVLMDKNTVNKLFQIYCVKHDTLFSSELLKNFERALHALINYKISDLLIVLIKKDESASVYFNSCEK